MNRKAAFVVTVGSAAVLAMQLSAASAAAQGRGPSVRPATVAPKGKPATPGAHGRAVAAKAKSKPAGPKSTTTLYEETGTTGHKPTPGELLARNTQLASRLQDLLPGANLQTAISGFPNLGLFVATAHVAHNLGLSFDQMKMLIVGQGKSLGQAIQELRPHANAADEVKKAQHAADNEIATTEGVTDAKKKKKDK